MSPAGTIADTLAGSIADSLAGIIVDTLAGDIALASIGEKESIAGDGDDRKTSSDFFCRDVVFLPTGSVTNSRSPTIKVHNYNARWRLANQGFQIGGRFRDKVRFPDQDEYALPFESSADTLSHAVLPDTAFVRPPTWTNAYFRQ